VASASTGLISGSSIANVVTTGTFTIPLMKSVGYRADKAASVEVASSVNGQLMPPVMGAAAFLMVEYVGISYVQVMKHAILPALISYIALYYIVHLEALKMNLQGLPRREPLPWQRAMISTTMTVSGLVILSAIIYWGFGWLKTVFGESTFIVIGLLMLGAYVALVRYAANFPELHMEKPDEKMEYLPEIAPTLKAGLHFLLPVAALIWNLMVEQLSPALSAFWATLFLMFILVTQRPLFALFRRTGDVGAAAKQGFSDLFSGLVTGARNMIGIAIATATAGIIVGTVTLTGIGLAMTELVEVLSGGNLMIMLILVALICLILGMGLPTTANYIVVSTLMAPVIVELGAQTGLLVPLIAVHMFVFYFGLMADVTPPVGLASYAAAGIAKSEPMLTGLTAFGYSARTAILPFMFIFNTQLLLIGIDNIFQLILTIITATVASMMFAAATQGYFITKSPAARVDAAAAGDLHAVPPGLLDGHNVSALRRDPAHRAHPPGRRSAAQRQPARVGGGHEPGRAGHLEGRAAAARQQGREGQRAPRCDGADGDDAGRSGPGRRSALRQPGRKARAGARLHDHRDRDPIGRAPGQGVDVRAGLHPARPGICDAEAAPAARGGRARQGLSTQ
jgi:TRAP transporter 4TM/12TM fusion protein